MISLYNHLLSNSVWSVQRCLNWPPLNKFFEFSNKYPERILSLPGFLFCLFMCVCERKILKYVIFESIHSIKYPERILSFPGLLFVFVFLFLYGPDTISEKVWSIILLRGCEAFARVSRRRTRLPSRMRSIRPGEPAKPAPLVSRRRTRLGEKTSFQDI